MRSAIGLSVMLLLGAAAGSCAQDPAQTSVVLAASPSSPLPIKIATIFGQNAIISTQEGQKASAALTAKYAPKKDEYNRKQAALQGLMDQLKKGQATMSQAARDQLNRTIDARTRELQRLGEDSQNALEQDEGAMMQQLGEKLLEVIREYASRNGYAAVIDVSVPNGPVIWASPRVDVTSEIVKMYDEAHPVAPTPAAAPPAKK